MNLRTLGLWGFILMLVWMIGFPLVVAFVIPHLFTYESYVFIWLTGIAIGFIPAFVHDTVSFVRLSARERLSCLAVGGIFLAISGFLAFVGIKFFDALGAVMAKGSIGLAVLAAMILAEICAIGIVLLEREFINESGIPNPRDEYRRRESIGIVAILAVVGLAWVIGGVALGIGLVVIVAATFAIHLAFPPEWRRREYERERRERDHSRRLDAFFHGLIEEAEEEIVSQEEGPTEIKAPSEPRAAESESQSQDIFDFYGTRPFFWSLFRLFTHFIALLIGYTINTLKKQPTLGRMIEVIIIMLVILTIIRLIVFGTL